MLNGKFFTGLPPKMMERNASTQNRQESHLFWPDESRAESVQDARQKRRASLQAESSPYGRDGGGLQRQSSTGGGLSEVDTKQRFKKEFANSSIQFYDNIQEEDMGSRRQAIRKPLIRQALKQEIAIKPTAMNMKLPNGGAGDAHEEYAAIKKSQAFDSKIQFYDYTDADGGERQRPNNRLKPKMDMNDKKDVERNSKNSPKLQVKGIVPRSRAMDGPVRVNDRRDRDYEEESQQPRHSTRFIRNEVHDEQRGNKEHFDGRRNNNQRYNDRPMRGDRHREPIDEGHDSRYDDAIDVHESRKSFSPERAPRRTQNEPKRILKNPIRDEGDFNDLDYVERGVQKMSVRPSPKKHVTYGDESYDREELNGGFDYDDGTNYNNTRSHRRRENVEFNLRNGGNNQSGPQPQWSRGGRASDYGANEEDRSGYDCTEGNNSSGKTSNLNKSNNSNHINNNKNNSQQDFKPNNLTQQQQRQRRQQQREITPKISASPMASASNASESTSASAAPLSPTTMDARTHLRSSLCFSGGEIVAKPDHGTPTADSSSRRTARSAATSRRVCVGLPD